MVPLVSLPLFFSLVFMVGLLLFPPLSVSVETW
jgi:hypothetical protein